SLFGLLVLGGARDGPTHSFVRSALEGLHSIVRWLCRLARSRDCRPKPLRERQPRLARLQHAPSTSLDTSLWRPCHVPCIALDSCAGGHVGTVMRVLSGWRTTSAARCRPPLISARW